MILKCKNYVKSTYYMFQKNSRMTAMKSSESVRISGASSESMILLSRGLRPLSSSFGSVVRILRSFLVISSMWRPFSILKPMPTFSRKKVLFLLVQCCQLLFHTVWKLQNFSVTQNLREIKVGKFKSQNLPFLHIWKI